MAQISPAVPSTDLIKSCKLVSSAPGGDAIARNAGLPSSLMRICTNCPGLTYPFVTSSATLTITTCNPPSFAARSLDTIVAEPHSKSFHPARIKVW